MMKRRKVYLSPRNASIVKLNVGGRAFHTTEDTLSLCALTSNLCWTGAFRMGRMIKAVYSLTVRRNSSPSSCNF